ncbi:MAG: oxidoreductase C-terminal domain-containing protein [Candidatus Nitrosopolaris sp.]
MTIATTIFFETRKELLEKQKRGEHKCIRYISNITQDNAKLAKEFLDAGIQIRHVKNLPPMSFGVSDKEIAATIERMDVEERRLVVAYGQNGRIVAALTVNAPLLLPAYQALIEARAPFPPELHAADGPVKLRPVSAGFPPHGHTTHSPVAVSTGTGPSTPEPPTKGEAARLKDPRVPPGPPPL